MNVNQQIGHTKINFHILSFIKKCSTLKAKVVGRAATKFLLMKLKKAYCL